MANFFVKKVLLRVVDHLLSKTALGRDRDVRALITVVENVGNSFVILTIAMAIAAGLDVGEAIYRRWPQASVKPIKGYIQILTIAIYAIAAVAA